MDLQITSRVRIVWVWFKDHRGGVDLDDKDVTRSGGS